MEYFLEALQMQRINKRGARKLQWDIKHLLLQLRSIKKCIGLIRKVGVGNDQIFSAILCLLYFILLKTTTRRRETVSNKNSLGFYVIYNI